MSDAGPAGGPPTRKKSADIEGLIETLEDRIEDLAKRACDIFCRIVPETQKWSDAQRRTFLDQARGRFSAVLAIMEHGVDVDEAIRADLQEVGANAAHGGASLPQLLIALRISRDVLLQAAMRVSEEDADRWKPVLLTFSQRMLPAVDRLTDAITMGFWNAKLDQKQEALHRLSSLVERIPYGIYEVDMDGLIRFANPAFASLFGHAGERVEGYPLNSVLRPVEGSLSPLLSEPPDDVMQHSIVAKGSDGHAVTFDIDTAVRRIDGVIVGFAGVVRPSGPLGTPVDLTPLVRHIHELRRSIEILEDAGEFIHRNAPVMSQDQITDAGESMAKQAQRLMLIVDELDADRRALQPVEP
jgi:PAS domain S-box-containing protein